jgi:hypothetical protein
MLVTPTRRLIADNVDAGGRDLDPQARTELHGQTSKSVIAFAMIEARAQQSQVAMTIS